MRHISKIKLRNEYDIYVDEDTYIVESPIGKSDEKSHRIIKKEIVEIFRDLFKGERISIKEAIEIIKSHKYNKYLNTYGWKKSFEVEKILLCIIAAGGGNIEKEGRKYIYEIYD
jgi:hypothetical protein